MPESFAPIARSDATRLILGTMPGKASLLAGEYYAHPRNAFWSVVGAALEFTHDAPYATRVRAVQDAGVAIWDVLHACTRATSLDSDIVADSIVANDFARFFHCHSRIETIFFNGDSARRLYVQHVLPGLPADIAGLPCVRLPSTSPAHAAMSLPAKRRAWSAIATRTA
jgi:double-stranded uracil-DNA glycosylase